ncbi:MAG TPA: metal ABC transporter permease [Bdellovibrionota bacterium]|nr:metal ABC transporter permease [Bdellovibrionota bacterium]
MTAAEWTEVFRFLAAPFVMCLILAGIHCYLGLHVLARGVIFVDLSLAQVAAFGATVAILFGFEHHGTATYFVSLAATFLAAALFSLARRHEELFPQEAVIGIVYALSSAAVVLVVDRAAHGAEHIKDLLVGQVLWVTWGDVFRTGLIYGAVGAVHFIFRKPLIRSSFEKGERTTPFWDFLFYALFGVVITSSVSLAGILQVFAYLIVPSVVSTLFCKSIRARLLFGWTLGFCLSLLGIVFSHRWDLPAGAFIVVCFTSLPVLLLLLLPLTKLLALRK